MQKRPWNRDGHPETQLGWRQSFCEGSYRDPSRPRLNSEVTMLGVYFLARQEELGELSRSLL